MLPSTLKTLNQLLEFPHLTSALRVSISHAIAEEFQNDKAQSNRNALRLKRMREAAKAKDEQIEAMRNHIRTLLDQSKKLKVYEKLERARNEEDEKAKSLELLIANWDAMAEDIPSTYDEEEQLKRLYPDIETSPAAEDDPE